MRVKDECKVCELFVCLSQELNLSEEDTKKLAKLEMERDPEKIISFLESIKGDDRLRKAVSKCKLY